MSFSSGIHLFLDCFTCFGMVYLAVSKNASTNNSHIVLPFCANSNNYIIHFDWANFRTVLVAV